ncbi:Fic family protein [Metallibacterium scheffleri]|uniref:Fic family protein n=1 Tax=Metallibacterium scheffleri TaxID=993689 RepID=UPI00144714B4|nr:Fic family protein [Metallibacterium scheffleri]
MQNKLITRPVLDVVSFADFIDALKLRRFTHRLAKHFPMSCPPSNWTEYSLSENRIVSMLGSCCPSEPAYTPLIWTLELINNSLGCSTSGFRDCCVTEAGDAGSRYVYPDASEIAPALDALSSFLEDGTTPFVFRAIVAHAFIVAVHPFQDGNGRTARIFLNLFLRRHIRDFYFPLREIQWSITAYYYIASRKAIILNDWQFLLNFFCRLFDKSLLGRNLI